MKTRLAIALLLLPVLPFSAFGQKREIVELQRDLAALQDQVRTMQRSMDEKLTALTVLVQQTLDSTNNANKAMTALETRMDVRLSDQEKKVNEPVVTIGTKVDQLATEFQGARENLSDVLSRLGKLEQRMVDLSSEVRSINAPAPPPPGATTGVAPAIPAEQLYESARRDTMGGKTDLGLQQFADYLKAYPDTENAPNAQYWIGQIYYDKSDYDAAMKNFDLLLTNYPESRKVADGLYMKGQSLLKLNRRTDAAKEFRKLYSEHPKHELAAKACAELRRLGYTTCSASSTAKKRS